MRVTRVVPLSAAVVACQLFELEYLEEAVGAGVDDDQVLVAVDGDALGRVDVGRDGVMWDAVDRSFGVDVTGPVQQHATVAFIAYDEVVGAVETQAVRLVQLVVSGTSLSGNSAHIAIV